MTASLSVLIISTYLLLSLSFDILELLSIPTYKLINAKKNCTILWQHADFLSVLSRNWVLARYKHLILCVEKSQRVISILIKCVISILIKYVISILIKWNRHWKSSFILLKLGLCSTVCKHKFVLYCCYKNFLFYEILENSLR